MYFFSKGVTYLEFQINEHRVFPVKEKIEDMLLNTKPPRNTEIVFGDDTLLSETFAQFSFSFGIFT